MIAIITDTHQGARGGSSIFREYFRWWYETQFFDVLQEQGIRTILHLGDFFDNRNAITLQDIDFVSVWFAEQLRTRNMHLIITIGNHDVAYKNTNKIHSLSMLKAAAPNNVTVIEEATLMSLEGQQYALVPWINAENYTRTFDMLNGITNKDDVIVAGHFEITGAKHYAKSAPAEHGLDPAVFSSFKELWSGHFHHKSKMANIRYMGSAFHLNWQDHNDARGFHTFDAATGSLVFVENEYSLFVEVAFDATTFKAMTDEQCAKLYESRFVRLFVDGDYDKAILLDTIAKINRIKPHDLQVINNAMLKKSDVVEDAVVVDVTKSTQEYIMCYMEERPDYNLTVVKDKMMDLFGKAQQAMVKGE
jgi:DNA repair exonuclease SbcCD nuclease subunit